MDVERRGRRLKSNDKHLTGGSLFTKDLGAIRENREMATRDVNCRVTI